MRFSQRVFIVVTTGLTDSSADGQDKFFELCAKPFAHTTVNYEVDGGINDQQEVTEALEDKKNHGHMKLVVFNLTKDVVFNSAVTRMGDLINLDDKAEGVTKEKSEHDSDEYSSRLFSSLLKMLRSSRSTRVDE